MAGWRKAMGSWIPKALTAKDAKASHLCYILAQIQYRQTRAPRPHDGLSTLQVPTPCRLFAVCMSRATVFGDTDEYARTPASPHPKGRTLPPSFTVGQGRNDTVITDSYPCHLGDITTPVTSPRYKEYTCARAHK